MCVCLCMYLCWDKLHFQFLITTVIFSSKASNERVYPISSPYAAYM